MCVMWAAVHEWMGGEQPRASTVDNERAAVPRRSRARAYTWRALGLAPEKVPSAGAGAGDAGFDGVKAMMATKMTVMKVKTHEVTARPKPGW